MLEFNNVSIHLKDSGRPLIENFNFVLQPNDKIAIIGEEGNGKSTLLKAVVDKSTVLEYANIDGVISTRGLSIGYLEQSFNKDWFNETVMDYLLKDNIDSEPNYGLLNSIYDLFNTFKLKKDLLDNDQLIKTLSGGEKVKIQLVKILCLNPDILLLDEPTNDIDINTLIWLENFIKEVKKPVLYVSHDEKLLENTANGIIHLEQIKKKTESRYTIERIPYTEYMEKRFNLLAHQEQVARKQRSDYDKKMEDYRQIYQKVEYRQNTISRQDPHGAALLKKKIKSLKSQERRFEKEKSDFLDIPDTEDAINLKYSLDNKIPSNKVILDYENESLEIGNKKLSKNIKLKVVGNEHVVFIGDNGVGKTTLLKEINKLLINRKDIKVGYMSQNYDDLLDIKKTPVDFLAENGSKEEITTARTFLGSLKFTAEESTNEIKYLSGGQKAKVLILSLVLNKCNVLLLDEPTRNLSPLSNPVIRKILSDFEGCIISVSHDRKYIEEVCDKIYELTKDGLIMKHNL